MQTRALVAFEQFYCCTISAHEPSALFNGLLNREVIYKIEKCISCFYTAYFACD